MKSTLALALVAAMVIGLSAYAYIGTDERCTANAGSVFQDWWKCEKTTCIEPSGGYNYNAQVFGCGVALLYIPPEDVERGCVQKQVSPRPGLNYPDCCEVYIWCP